MVRRRKLRIAHLFADVLRAYGDNGNTMAIVARAEARSIDTTIVQVGVGASRLPPVDLVLIGGGQDREQETVARELERLGEQLRLMVGEGTALLAVCGGFQNLGRGYRTALGVELACPGLFPVSTDAFGAPRRLVGPVVAAIHPDLETRTPPGRGDLTKDRVVVGFENHGGVTVLDDGARPFAKIEIGHGNNDQDGTEGALLLPGEGGLRGLRLGTYLHGPLLPRNPLIADILIAFALGGQDGPVELAPVDDRAEWAAHDAACAGLRRAARRDRRIPDWAHRAVDPIRSLIGY